MRERERERDLEHQPKSYGSQGCEKGRDEGGGIRGRGRSGGEAIGSGLLDSGEGHESYHQCNEEAHLHRLHCDISRTETDADNSLHVSREWGGTERERERRLWG